MKNLLTLHKSNAIILLGQPKRTATFQTIADEIEHRKLFQERKGGTPLSEQIKLRTSISSSKYKHRFEFTCNRCYLI